MHRQVRILPSLLKPQRRTRRGWQWFAAVLVALGLAVVVWRSQRALSGHA